MLLWSKALHLWFMVAWFTALLYLPRIFSIHASSDDARCNERFKLMEWRLFRVSVGGAVLTLTFGGLMLYHYPSYLAMPWMQIKLVLIALVLAYHGYCAKMLFDFMNGCNRHSETWYRWFSELPLLALVPVIFLATLRPF